MKKQLALGLVAGVIALASTAFAPEAQAKDNKQALNQLAMQMYVQNLAKQQNLAAQQQLYGQYGYNPYLNNGNNAYLNQLHTNQNLSGNANFNGYYGYNYSNVNNGNNGQCHRRHHRHNQNGILSSTRNFINGNGFNVSCGNGLNSAYYNGNYNSGYYNNGFLNNGLGYDQSTVGRLLNRIF